MSGPADDPLGAMRQALDGLVDPRDGYVPVALGWATVDLDRMERVFAEAYPGSVTSTQDLVKDQLLGAYCRLVLPGVAGVPALVLIEPSTEGRLAATLARHGEGPLAIWLEDPRDLHDPPDAPDAPGAAVAADPLRSSPVAGPFGTEALLLGGPIHGPHRLVVLAGPGTITP